MQFISSLLTNKCVEIIPINERGVNQLFLKLKPFQYLKHYYLLHIFSYDNATSITEGMMIINHTHMIEIGKFHLYLSTYSNEATTSALHSTSCGEHQLS